MRKDKVVSFRVSDDDYALLVFLQERCAATRSLSEPCTQAETVMAGLRLLSTYYERLERDKRRRR